MLVSSCYTTKLTLAKFPQNVSAPLQAKDQNENDYKNPKTARGIV